MRSSTLSSVPDDSPASIIATNSRLKTFGWRANAFESTMPASTSERTSAITWRRYLSSVCCSSVVSAETTLTPASIIVASCREKTCSDFGLTRLNRARGAFAARGPLAQRPRAAGRAPGAARGPTSGRRRGSRRAAGGPGR